MTYKKHYIKNTFFYNLIFLYQGFANFHIPLPLCSTPTKLAELYNADHNDFAS